MFVWEATRRADTIIISQETDCYNECIFQVLMHNYDEMHITCDTPILYFGTPVALLSTKNHDNTDNLSPISSIFWLGWRCIIGLGAANKTTENLLKTKECVINLPSVNEVAAVDKLALKTGTNPVPQNKLKRGYEFEANKIELAGFTTETSELISSVRIKECPVQMEAEVVEIHQLGKDDPTITGRIVTFELKILRVHIDESILVTNAVNKIDPDKWRPLIMSFQKFYGLSDQIYESTLAKIPEKLYGMNKRK